MRVRLDINNVLSEAVGEHGLTVNDLEQSADIAAAAVRAVVSRKDELGWPTLPDQDTSEVEAVAADIRSRVDQFVVLGIGGSALGNIAVHNALNHPFYNELPANRRTGPRLYVLDNSDPELNTSLLDTIDLSRTVFNVISKSGTTGETMASFLFFRQKLIEAVGAEHLGKHIILTTDPSSGFLREIGTREGWRMLDLPPKVGGRFSVLTNVGLLSAAVTGIDLKALLAGAAYGFELANEPDPLINVAALGALVNFLLERNGKNMVVMMPYAQRLRYFADWFAQLWAESLGKKVGRSGRVVHTGTTPVKALGATDQHSQVQLYAEGPFDKLMNFLAVDRYGNSETPIPTAYNDLEGVSYLGGHSFDELIKAEQRATAIALTEAGRPNMTHTIPEVNAFTLGQLLMLFEMQTAIAGELLDINAFDQPGVEAGKIATYALLGRTGFEARRAEIEAAQAKSEARWIV
jgi:glucose-6-phosphate isomerase